MSDYITLSIFLSDLHLSTFSLISPFHCCFRVKLLAWCRCVTKPRDRLRPGSDFAGTKTDHVKPRSLVKLRKWPRPSRTPPSPLNEKSTDSYRKIPENAFKSYHCKNGHASKLCWYICRLVKDFNSAFCLNVQIFWYWVFYFAVGGSFSTSQPSWLD